MIRAVVTLLLALIAAPALGDPAVDFAIGIKLEEQSVRQEIQANARVRTLVVGDSISASVDTTNLCGKTVNISVGGYGTSEARAMLEYALTLIKPDLVILATGTNDYPETFTAKYDPLLQLIQAKGIKPVLVGTAYRPANNDAIQVRAYFGGWPFVAPLSGSAYTIDTIGHLTPAGQTEWFNRVRAACLPLIN